jgi:hypothetical protein
MGFDTDVGHGERTIAGSAGYVKPMLTADGRRIVITSRKATGTAGPRTTTSSCRVSKALGRELPARVAAGSERS